MTPTPAVDNPILVELLGIAQVLAGRHELTVTARTLDEAIAAVQAVCPGLRVRAGHFLYCLDGGPFLSAGNTPLPPGARLLWLGADVGG
jgi:hypothetical protein